MIRTLLPLLLLVAICSSTLAQQKEPPKPRRTAALKSKDEAKVFSPATMKKAQATADKLLKEKDLDLLIETLATTAPKMDPAKLKAMTAEEREKYFKDYALERCKAEKLSGVYIMVCRNPGFMWVEVHGSAAATFPPGIPSRFTQTLLKAFRDKKFDAGLTEGIQQILEVQGLAEKEKEKK